MTEVGYKIEPDVARRFIRLTLFGFWDEATVERYKKDLGSLMAAATLPTRSDGFRVLLDLRRHTLLAKDHADTLQGALAKPPPGQRLAVLLADAQLLKRQAGRVASPLEPRFFHDEHAALAWLFDTALTT